MIQKAIWNAFCLLTYRNDLQSFSSCLAVPFALLDFLSFFTVSFTRVGVWRRHFKREPLLGLSRCLVLANEQEPACAGRSLGLEMGWNHRRGSWACWYWELCSRAQAAVNSCRFLGGSEGDLRAGTHETWWQGTGSPAVKATSFSLGTRKRASRVEPWKSGNFCPLGAPLKQT